MYLNLNMDSDIPNSHQSNNDNSSSSSFAESIKLKLLKGLKPTETKLISIDGSITILKNQALDLADASSSQSQSRVVFGFVVDNKPDLTIGKVTPWLFISSQDVPNDINLIQQNKIRHILSLLPGFILDSRVKPIIKSHLVLEIFDETDFKLDSPVISSALKFINDCYNLKDNCLVHCNAGVSRAPSVVILYLMSYEKFSYEEALKLVSSARPIAKPNEGFVKQLKFFN